MKYILLISLCANLSDDYPKCLNSAPSFSTKEKCEAHAKKVNTDPNFAKLLNPDHTNGRKLKLPVACVPSVEVKDQ